MPKDGSPGILTTQLDTVVNWARKNSLWPLPFGTSCCGIEMMATLSADYDMSRFGAEVVRFSPRQSDLIICAGTITNKMAPVLKTIYEQMSDPKWVMAFGVCTCSGGIYNSYSVLQGIDMIIPVDIYIPGCPPSPEGVIYGLMELQERIKQGDYGPNRKRPARDQTPEKSFKV
jgi:NADH-quinone oxidoreductase subunit B